MKVYIKATSMSSGRSAVAGPFPSFGEGVSAFISLQRSLYGEKHFSTDQSDDKAVVRLIGLGREFFLKKV